MAHKYSDHMIFVVLVLGERSGFMYNRCVKTVTAFEKVKV